MGNSEGFLNRGSRRRSCPRRDAGGERARAEENHHKEGRTRDEMDLPKGLSLCTMRRGGEWGLGVKTERGILDIEAASDHFDIDDVPETMDELLRAGGGNEVQDVVEKSLSAKGTQRLFLKRTSSSDASRTGTNHHGRAH